MDDDPVAMAHRNCSLNRSELTCSARCGCFHCLATYSPEEISEWIDGNQTALCPRCGIDSVIADQSGYPLTQDFLAAMHDR